MEQQKPTVGRIVHYYPSGRQFEGNDSSPLPAVITRVWSDTCVNLKIFTDGPHDSWVTSVTRSDDHGPYTWDWPERA